MRTSENWIDVKHVKYDVDFRLYHSSQGQDFDYTLCKGNSVFLSSEQQQWLEADMNKYECTVKPRSKKSLITSSVHIGPSNLKSYI